MMYAIGKTFRFEAAHRLALLGDTHKCHRLHGHNYEVTVELTQPVVGPSGMVVDYGDLSATFGAWLKEHVDHRILAADQGAFEVDRNWLYVVGAETTAENLARHFYDVIRSWDWMAYLRAVRVSETPGTWAEYRP